MTRASTLAVFIALALLALMAIPLIHAATATDYAYRIPVVITNGASTTLDYPVCALINPPGLIAAGYLQADALDVAAFNGAESEISLTRQDPTDAGDCWWIAPPQDLLPGQVAASYIHLGATQTGDHDNGNSFVVRELVNESLADGTSPNWEHVTSAVFALGTFTLDALPSVGAILIKVDGQYEFGITSAGALYGKVWCAGGACASGSPHTITGTTLVVGTTYGSLAFNWDLTNANDDGLFINGVLDTGFALSGSMVNNANSVMMLASLSADVEMLAFRSAGAVYTGGSIGSCGSVTYTTCYDFTPDDITQSQEGTSANAWHWTGIVDNDASAGSATDANYLFVRDHASITVDVQAIQTKSTLPTAITSSTLNDVIGTLDPLGIATTTADAGNAPTFLDTLKAAAFFAGGTNDGVLMAVMVFLGSLAGGGMILLTKQTWVGSMTLGGIVFMGGPLVFYGWAWVAIALITIFAMGGAMAFLGKR